jgi:hypothetical protein
MLFEATLRSQIMNVKSLTRENVASHLQKYRLQLRRSSGECDRQVGSMRRQDRMRLGVLQVARI